jgi:glycosyltransferase involved in cell wall biosynthesis
VIFEQALAWCDIIVLYSVPTNGIQTLLSSRIASKPVVFHSFDILHRLAEYDFLRFPTWALERVVYPRADKIVVISESLRKYMRDLGVPQENIVLIPPAINIQRFNPSVSSGIFRSAMGLSNEDQVLLFSGWLYDFCGLDLVMNSMKPLVSEFPRIKLVICGEGPLQSRLSLLMEQLGLQDHVRILGRRPYEEMPHIVAASDICINPYLPTVASNFAFPSKIAEYMASGKPVVASDLPGTRSLLDERSGVILIHPSRFSSTIRDLLLDHDRIMELGRIAREYCEVSFSLESITRKFENVLNDVLDRKRNADLALPDDTLDHHTSCDSPIVREVA